MILINVYITKWLPQVIIIGIILYKIYKVYIKYIFIELRTIDKLIDFSISTFISDCHDYGRIIIRGEYLIMLSSQTDRWSLFHWKY